jgi:hypothetical protein
MSAIKITDLFGINILTNRDINKDYIIIHFSNDNIDDLLIPINQYNGIYIYKLNKNSNYFNKLHSKNIFNINDYNELGTYLIYDKNNIQILLVKNNIGTTNTYKLLDVVGNLYVWKPIYKYTNHINFGVVVTTDKQVPTETIGTINTDYIKLNSPISINNDSLFENEYSVLGSIRDNKKKLLSIKILNDKKTEKIEHFDNIDNIDDIDDKQYYNNDSEYNNYSIDDDMENNHQSLNTYKGKRLVLVESDNPWYVNKENVIELKYINNQNYFGIRQKYPLGSAFKSNTVYNTTSPNLGYGYSYADRKNTIVENFSENTEDNSNNNANYIIVIMIIIIILLLAYNYYKKNNNSKITY